MPHEQTLKMLLLGACVALGCGPKVEPVDEQGYALCVALYDHARSCGRDIAEDSATKCAHPSKWDTCRDLRVEQFQCYTALTCEDDANKTEAYQACEAKLHEAGTCIAAERD